MISDESQLEYFKKIANDNFSVLIKEDYGSGGIERLTILTEKIAKIYKHLNFLSFERIIIFTALDQGLSLDKVAGSNCNKCHSINNLTQIHGTEITIEVTENLELLISVNFIPSLDLLRSNAVVYERHQTVETILGKIQQRTLREIPNTDSYFAIKTYKELDIALEDYKVIVARYSDSCSELRNVWLDSNKIFFKPRPESKLRDSLIFFLKIRLRNTEVRPEQVVDASHPVDIKITWEYTTYLALIEIKWLGKSLMSIGGGTFNQIYSHSRALEGANQLVDYLDKNKIQAPQKITKGYLVVFDARRWGTNTNTEKLTKAQGFRYENNEINYNPDYSQIRSDFARPVRFFMEPKCID